LEVHALIHALVVVLQMVWLLKKDATMVAVMQWMHWDVVL